MAEHTDKQDINTPDNAEVKTPQAAVQPKPEKRPMPDSGKGFAAQDDPSRKVSLVELIMILMLVGLVLVFIFGMQQMKIDKQKELIAHQKVEQVLPSFELLIKAMEDYRKADEFGDYPIDLGELDVANRIRSEDFTFDYDPDGLTISATSTEAFGKKGVEILYSLSNSVYEVNDPSPKEKPTVKDDWLP